MKWCDYCGRGNSDAAPRCKECGSGFPAASAGPAKVPPAFAEVRQVPGAVAGGAGVVLIFTGFVWATREAFPPVYLFGLFLVPWLFVLAILATSLCLYTATFCCRTQWCRVVFTFAVLAVLALEGLVSLPGEPRGASRASPAFAYGGSALLMIAGTLILARMARRKCLHVLLVLGCLALPASAPAASFVSSEADLLNDIGASQSFLNEFSDLVDPNVYAHPLAYSSNGLAYEITSAPPFDIYSLTGAVSTATSTSEIVVSFTTTNVHATGGQVFLTDVFGVPASGVVRVVLDDATTNTLSTFGSQLAFAGYFTGSKPFASFRVGSQTAGCYPTLDHFWVAEGVPVLTVAVSGAGAIAVRWPAPATGYVLQFSFSLSNPDWADMQQIPQLNGDFWEVTAPMYGSAAFFRLIRK